MPQEIKTIRLPMPYRLGVVNCYLLAGETGFILIDTGASNKRSQLEEELKGAGCGPGDLKLVVLTHGDFDHSGNAAYIRGKFGAQIAMHRDDCGMVEHGDTFWNREKGNFLLRTMAAILFRFGKAERFKPDLYLDEGDDLSEFGLDARVLHIPGHSKGSIGIQTAGGGLFCGDLLVESGGRPTLNSIIDDPAVANASVEKLKGLEISTVYPGHGKPFPMDLFIEQISMDKEIQGHG